jgi:hypothetical protein
MYPVIALRRTSSQKETLDDYLKDLPPEDKDENPKSGDKPENPIKK